MGLTNKKQKKFNSCMKLRLADINGDARKRIEFATWAFNESIRRNAEFIQRVNLCDKEKFKDNFNAVSRQVEATLKDLGLPERNWGKGYPVIQPLSEHYKRYRRSILKKNGKKTRLPRVRNKATYLASDHKMFGLIERDSKLFFLFRDDLNGSEVNVCNHKLLGGWLGKRARYIEVPVVDNEDVRKYMARFKDMTASSCILYEDKKTKRIYISISMTRPIKYAGGPTSLLGVDIGIAEDYVSKRTTLDGCQ